MTLLRTSGALGALVLVGCAVHAGAQPREERFVRRELVLGRAERQTVLTGFLLGGGRADVAVVFLEAGGPRRLCIHALDDEGAEPRVDVELSSDVTFVDVAHLDGRDRLLLHGAGGLRWFEPSTGREHALSPVASSLDPPRAGEVPHVDVSRDVNGDGRDDLVLPAEEGFLVAVQLDGGLFAEPVTVGSRPELAGILGADGYRYDPWSRARIFGMDYDVDGRVDLVSWAGEHFDVHLQDERGRFAPRPVRFTTDVEFDSDDPLFLTEGALAGRVLRCIVDLDGDGLGDLVVQTLGAGRSARKDSSLDVHFGERDPLGGTRFAPEPRLTLRSEGCVQLGLECTDLDGDGRLDLVVTTIEQRFLEGSLWKSFKGFMGDDIVMRLEFHRSVDGRFSREPDAVRTIALDGAPSHREPGSVDLGIVLRGATHEERRTRVAWPRAFNPTRLLGDVTGDGRSDLLLEESFRHLRLFAGTEGAGVFEERAEGVRMLLPGDGEYAWLADLNRDGKQDVVLHHPFSARDVHGGRELPPGAEEQRVVLWIAR